MKSLRAWQRARAKDVVTNSLLRVKVCMVGDSGVGKTSLVRRYVLDQFSDAYISTMGTKVTKKQMKLTVSEGKEIDLMMTLWDIMGEKELIGVVKESYFNGVSGIMAVCDLSREDTIDSLKEWLAVVVKTAGKVPVMIAANKLDLIPPKSIKRLSGKLDALAKDETINEILTSAKTNENVEIAFDKLALEILNGAIRNKRLAELSETVPEQ